MTSRPQNLAPERRSPATARPIRGTQPDYLYPPYASTVKRSPTQPLVLLPHTLSEVTGPVFGYDDVKPNDDDLTRQHDGEPIGERIVVGGPRARRERPAGRRTRWSRSGRRTPRAAIRTASTSTTRRSIRTSPAAAAR